MEHPLPVCWLWSMFVLCFAFRSVQFLSHAAKLSSLKSVMVVKEMGSLILRRLNAVGSVKYSSITIRAMRMLDNLWRLFCSILPCDNTVLAYTGKELTMAHFSAYFLEIFFL